MTSALGAVWSSGEFYDLYMIGKKAEMAAAP